MSVVLITGSCGLVGSESSEFFSRKGFEILGIDNNSRKKNVSVNFGTLEIEIFLSVNKQVAKIDKEEFFDPLISTLPKSGLPPCIDIFSILFR